ncbi:MAG: multidrug transporter [Rhodospirillales bacterium]|nr:multidrug transporter [Rhodospirillales bacterium]
MSQASAPKEDIRLGILNMLLSVALFAVMSVLVKWLSHFPPVELAFFRQVFAMVPIGLMLWHSGAGLRLLRTERPVAHATRALIGSTSMILVFSAFQMLPLADATALSFAQPLFLTALAGPLLGEKVRLHRWSAVIVGFIGVVVMARPIDLLSGSFNLGVVVALGSALTSALAMATVRQLSRSEASLTIIFYFSAIGAVLLGLAMLPFHFVVPTWREMPLVVAVGLVGGTAQYFLTQAYRFSPASALSPFTYSAIVWSTLLGWAIWAEVPTMATIAGALIVVASGLYIIWRETYRRVTVVNAGPVSPAAGD